MRPIALLAGFGAAVRGRRTERGLTQAQVAEAAGIAVETVSRIEGGRLASVSLLLASRVAATLGTTLTALLSGVPSPDPARSLRAEERRIVGLLTSVDDAQLGRVRRGLQSLLAVHDSATVKRKPRKRRRA
ncbi:MAG TPA: helix-turn-helix domain-containing protein [Polyangiaceae bacterium]|jgi:transcriptional regulator with XRE-family HTH domain|nr:helix-turn-helix domain-containing protein [Polyangiaceae bacterium]